MGDGDRVASWDDPFHKDDHGGYGDGHGSEDHTDETHSGIRLPVLNNAEVLA
jgi:hypothetical protein